MFKFLVNTSETANHSDSEDFEKKDSSKHLGSKHKTISSAYKKASNCQYPLVRRTVTHDFHTGDRYSRLV